MGLPQLRDVTGFFDAELLKLGCRLAQSTVSRYMVPRRGRPIKTWSAFLRDNAQGIAAIDLFGVPVLTFQRLYAVVVLGHGRRKILHVEVTDHPTALWLAQQITEAFPWDEAPKILIRDNDGAYGFVFRRRVRAMGVRDRPTRPHSPWMNGHVERLIGSIRRECLDHQIIWNAAHLRRVLRAYADYYNNDRPHLALDKDAPNPRAIEAEGEITSRSRVGGLHHRYGRRKRR
jgi:transposase InsO family protein